MQTLQLSPRTLLVEANPWGGKRSPWLISATNNLAASRHIRGSLHEQSIGDLEHRRKYCVHNPSRYCYWPHRLQIEGMLQGLPNDDLTQDADLDDLFSGA